MEPAKCNSIPGAAQAPTYTNTTTARGNTRYLSTLVSQSQCWVSFVLERSTLPAKYAILKTLSALVFSIERGATSFALPTKLSGTKRHQDAIGQLRQADPLSGVPLALERAKGGILVYYDGGIVGQVQRKHIAWAWPLIEHGLTLHLLQVTGTAPQHTMGVNVAFAHVCEAIERYQRAEIW